MSDPTARSLDPDGEPLAAVPTATAIAFPPLGNRQLVGSVHAAAAADPGMQALAASLAGQPPGPVGELSADQQGWLATVAQRANQDSFRAEVTGLAADPAPRLVRLAVGEHGGLDRPALAVGRGTAKLVLVVALGGEGTITLRLPGAEGRPALQAGSVCLWPSFLSASVDEAEGELVALVAVFEGPAWR